MTSDAREREIQSAIRRDIPREALVEVKEQFAIAAQQAFTAVSSSHAAVTNGLHLSRLRQSRAVGLMRYNVIDEAFEQILARHGAEFVKSVTVGGDAEEIVQAPVHLTVGVLGQTMVGFASHRDVSDAPSKNASRRALCYQNRGLSPDFFHPPEMFSDRKRLVLIMVRRDPSTLGKIASLTLSVIDSKMENFIYQADLDDFLAGYGSSPVSSSKPVFKLRSVAGGFKESRKLPAAEHGEE